VERLLAASDYPSHVMLGGYPEAERRLCLFLPDWMEPEDAVCEELTAIRATWYGEKALTHRDFLGSLMGMGIAREKVGDILVGEGRCDILILSEVRDFLLQSMESAGRSKLKLQEISLDELEPPKTEIKEIRDTVSTLRLDAVGATGFSTSRSKMAELISSGRVNLNWQECTKTDKLVSEGDTISCRGLGKCRLKTVGGQSRKGRTMIVMERYL
jgi:RNA-binding protein YlmH